MKEKKEVLQMQIAMYEVITFPFINSVSVSLCFICEWGKLCWFFTYCADNEDDTHYVNDGWEMHVLVLSGDLNDKSKAKHGGKVGF